MSKVIVYLREVVYLLGDARDKLPLMGLVFLIGSILDVVGIGLIAPYIGLIATSEPQISDQILYLLSVVGVSTDKNSLIIFFGMFLVAVFLFKTVIAILINKSIIKFSLDLSANLRVALMSSYQSMSYVTYIQRNSSEYIHNVNLADKFASSTVQALLRLASDTLVALMIILFLAMSNVIALGILVVLLGGLIVFYDAVFRPRIAEYGRLSNEYSTQIVQSVHEGVEGIKEIRILGKEEFFLKKLKDGAVGYSDVNVKSTMITNSPRFLLELIMVMFVVIFVWLSIILMNHGQAEVIMILSMFGVASIRLAPAANQIIGSITRLRFGRHSVHLLYSDLRGLREKVVVSEECPLTSKGDFSSIALDQIKFAYPNVPASTLCDVSIEIKKGDVVGFMGGSGAGKTTLIDVILGLLEPQTGGVLYNGQPMDFNRMREWRSQVAYLPQQVFLIDDTFRRNIALGLDENEIDDVRVVMAAEQAQLADLIKGLPDGIETVLGERGIRLSGGQRQRVALARAFYHQRDVLVLDESTSALDNETEREVVREISQLKGSNTMIVIAHRLTTLQHCDRIYRLDAGCIVDSGSYESII